MNRNSNVDLSYKNRMHRMAGEHFENIIAASLSWYEDRGVACIEKTPEPMKPLGAPDRQGRFLACYTKVGQPDFKGTLAGGRSVVFEAKHTDDDRIKYDRLTDEQVEKLNMHHELGALAFVLVSFGLQDFYRIPWEVWRDMKKIYGRKYIKQEEVEQYRVKYMSGVLKLLEDVYTVVDLNALSAPIISPDACVACGAYAGEGSHLCPSCQAKGARQ